MRLACAMFFLLIWGLSAAFLYEHWDEEQQKRLHENNIVLATTYRASVAMYRLSTEILFTQVIQRPEVIAAFAEGVLGKGETRDLARGKLYRLLAPAYAHLKQRGIRQLHFHTEDGHSFLRFHAPDKFGDPLFDIRPSVRLANTLKSATFGFETGRMNSGFRYVFPLFRDGHHLGSVETSITFRFISEAMAKIDPGREYLLVLKGSVVDRTLFEERRTLYDTSPIHDDFLVEDSRLRLPDSPPPLTATVQALNARLREDPRVLKGMPTGRPFSVAVTTDSGDFSVSFEPIKDILSENVAYVISYAKAPFLADLRRDFLLNLVFATLTLSGLFWLSLRLLNAYATLRQEKKHLQIVTDTIADGLCVMAPQGHIVQINPAFTDILGYRADEIIGQIGHNLFHFNGDGSSLPLAQCPIVSAMSKGEDYAGEEIFRHKNGQLLTVELSCKPIITETRIDSAVFIFRDITKRKATEERLQENDRIKSEFIATASHELRTPLAVIQGYTELLRENAGLSAEQMRDFEAIIYDKSVALEKIIDELLDVSRIESGRPLCLDFMQIDIVDEIRQVVAQFEKEAATHRFSTTLPEAGFNLFADRFKIIQVLDNLLNNAVKFSPAGSEIVVSGRLLDDCFQVMVADEGGGIAPEKQEHIFDKFFRVDASNTALSGFGLGLYLVKRIVEAHRGKIWVESTIGQGAKFFFTLPINS
ncbi:MAG: ATP-binding protein [Desulfuromonadales bacterium]